MSYFNKSSIVVRCDDFIGSLIDNQILVMNLDTGTCYGLNNVGTRIWTLIAVPISVSRICDTLTAEYRVDAALCESQVLNLLDDFYAEHMIKLVGDGTRDLP